MHSTLSRKQKTEEQCGEIKVCLGIFIPPSQSELNTLRSCSFKCHLKPKNIEMFVYNDKHGCREMYTDSLHSSMYQNHNSKNTKIVWYSTFSEYFILHYCIIITNTLLCKQLKFLMLRIVHLLFNTCFDIILHSLFSLRLVLLLYICSVIVNVSSVEH